MRATRPISLVVPLLVALLVPAGALAKGASEARITGPGLSSPLTLPGEGQPGGEQLMALADQAGFFAAVFGQSPDPMRDRPPEGDLGPRYTIVYTMPGPNNELDELEQDVYPFARPSPVTYTRPEQPFWTSERTRGGWFVAGPQLTGLLVAAGVPEPTGGPASGDRSWTLAGGAWLLSAALVLAAASLVVVWRRARGAAA